jgi:hypothetical protein
MRCTAEMNLLNSLGLALFAEKFAVLDGFCE